MNKKQLGKNIISIVLNLFIFISTLLCVISYFRSNNEMIKGFNCFRFFTTDSNIYVAIASLIIVIFTIIGLIKKAELPKWVLVLKYSGTVCVTLTFLTVLCFLWPTIGVGVFLNEALFLHVLNPLAAIVSYLLLEDEKMGKTFPSIIFAMIPMVVYMIVYLLCVLVFKCWPDFYGFNNNGNWFISLPLMATAMIVIAVALLHAKILISKKKQ